MVCVDDTDVTRTCLLNLNGVTLAFEDSCLFVDADVSVVCALDVIVSLPHSLQLSNWLSGFSTKKTSQALKNWQFWLVGRSEVGWRMTICHWQGEGKGEWEVLRLIHHRVIRLFVVKQGHGLSPGKSVCGCWGDLLRSVPLSWCDILNLTFCRLDFHQLLIKIS